MMRSKAQGPATRSPPKHARLAAADAASTWVLAQVEARIEENTYAQ